MSFVSASGLKRRPTHAGEMLREDFLVDYDLIVTGLAEALGVSRQSINELLRERRAVSPPERPRRTFADLCEVGGISST